MQDIRVFLIDQNELSGCGGILEQILSSQKSVMHVMSAPVSAALAGTIREYGPDLIFLVLPDDRSGLGSLVKLLTGSSPDVPILAVTSGDERSEDMIELLRAGVDDFISSPLRAVDIFPRIWRHVEQGRAGEPLVRRLKEKIGLRQMVGESPAFLEEIRKIPLVARCEATVLISGETGTGKELCARAIHYLGLRAGKPFIPVNCGAIHGELIERELFGHMKGAYTGADSSQPGLVEEAEGGTLFLDEIDCLPLASQVKLLRLLQEKEYRPIGSAKSRRADVRVITATNIDLGRAMHEGKFRQDLYYRLNVVSLVLPPLRERREDIPVLARHFLDHHASELDRDAHEFTPEAMQRLLLYDWPGNVRELENIIERAVVFSTAGVIDASGLPLPDVPWTGETESFRQAKARAVEKFEKDYLQSLLLTHGGNISSAARSAQKDRRAFWELIRKHNINVQDMRSAQA